MSTVWRSRHSGPKKSGPEFLELDITDLAEDGTGVARHEGRVVFVSGALPDERVRTKVTLSNSKLYKAKTTHVVSPSEHRVVPQCQYFDVCGGCRLQHMAPVAVIEAKQAWLIRQLEKHQLVAESVLPPITSEAYHYRRRARLGVVYRRGGAVIGFREEKSNQLVDIQECAILVPELNAVLPQVRRLLVGQKKVTHIELLFLNDTPTVVFRVPDGFDTQWQSDVEKTLSAEGVDAIFHADNWSHTIEMNLSGVKVEFGEGDFAQGNHDANLAMLAQTKDWLNINQQDKVADFFCGLGNFSFALASQANSVTGYEGVKTMVGRGNNAVALSALDNVKFEHCDLHEAGLRIHSNCNKAVMDPPRSGAFELSRAIAKNKQIEELVYVSCNPATFARDAAEIVAGGFNLKALRLIDMFPNSEHSEMMAYFQR